MKSIQIITDSTYFTIFDRDLEDLQAYTRNLSSVLESSKVVILHTSEQSVILRPNKITSIIISEVQEDEQIQSKPTIEIQQIDPPKNPEQNIEIKSNVIEEDVITDMD
jgi:hypothetical protein